MISARDQKDVLGILNLSDSETDGFVVILLKAICFFVKKADKPSIDKGEHVRYNNNERVHKGN